MKNYKFKRALSYFIDLLIISIIISLLSNIKAINPKYKEYREAYTKYSEALNEAVNSENKSLVIDKDMEKLMFEVSYYSISFTIIEFGVILLYFTFFPFFFGGQTIGKKILKLRIESTNEDKKPSFISYLLRALLLPMFSTGLFYCVITLVGNLICLVIFKEAHFMTINKIFMMSGIIWGYADTIYCLSRQDNKSLHDLITKTQVVEINSK
jgi:uncharacterized RDD family membrane protein YckC